MKKFYNRLLSFVLAMVMCFMIPVNSFVFAQESNKGRLIDNKLVDIGHDNELEEYEIWETYDEKDGVKYYFKDTPQYTINIIGDANIHVYFKDKSKNTLKVYENNQNTITQNSTLNNIKIDLPDFSSGLNDKDIEQYVSNCELKEEYNVSDFEINEFRASDYEIARRIDKKLSEYYGSTYSSKLIDSMSEQGKYAKLYERMHFERYKYHNWWLDAGTAIGLVATVVSWPATTIAAICATYTTATGVISLVNSFRSYEYVANVHWNKEVKVGSIYPYRAGKTTKGRVLLGDKDAAYKKGKTTKHSDFDDNKGLMRIGINNYIEYN